jgi:hypothetical protein
LTDIPNRDSGFSEAYERTRRALFVNEMLEHRNSLHKGYEQQLERCIDRYNSMTGMQSVTLNYVDVLRLIGAQTHARCEELPIYYDNVFKDKRVYEQLASFCVAHEEPATLARNMIFTRYFYESLYPLAIEDARARRSLTADDEDALAELNQLKVVNIRMLCEKFHELCPTLDAKELAVDAAMGYAEATHIAGIRTRVEPEVAMRQNSR